MPGPWDRYIDPTTGQPWAQPPTSISIWPGTKPPVTRGGNKDGTPTGQYGSTIGPATGSPAPTWPTGAPATGQPAPGGGGGGGGGGAPAMPAAPVWGGAMNQPWLPWTDWSQTPWAGPTRR